VPLSILPDPKKLAAYPHRTCQDLRPGDWGSDIDWEANRIGRNFDVRITRHGVEAWLNQGRDPESDASEPSADAARSGAICGEGATPNQKPSRKQAVRHLKDEVYVERVNQFLRAERRYPTRDEDQQWGSGHGFHREVMRVARGKFLPAEIKKGGPRKQLSDEDINLAIENLAAKLPR